MVQRAHLVHDLHLHSNVGTICSLGSKIRLCSGNGDGTVSHQRPDWKTPSLHGDLGLSGKKCHFLYFSFFQVTHYFLLLNKRQREKNL